MKQLLRRWTALLIMTLVFLVIVNVVHAQEYEQNITNASGYLDSRIGSLHKYISRSKKIQQRLLRKLKRKEARFEKQLAAKDSALYLQYKQHGISYDSIAVLSQDSSKLKSWAAKKNVLTDSLKSITHFIGDQQNKLGQVSGAASKDGAQLPFAAKIGQLQQQLNAQQNIDQLIQQRTSALEGMARNQNIGGLQNLQKDLYYAREKIKSWKELADDPDAAEEKALEYLQGSEGFAGYLNGSNNNNAFGGVGGNATAKDLQRMGFQTKGQVSAILQQAVGGNMSEVQQQMTAQVQQFTEKLSGVTGKIQEVKNDLNDARQSLTTAKQAAKDARHIPKPAFTPNPEKGKPFWRRLEVQYNFQSSRASPDGLRPAMFDLGASVAFKYSPSLSYGLGLGFSAGLGNSWQHIKVSYEGIVTRAFADWKWQYGFSLQAGYERSFRPGNRSYLPDQPPDGNATASPSNRTSIIKDIAGRQQQAAYLGIMKRYRIGGKWNGTLLLAYNFLWQNENLRSPFLLRFGWAK